MTMTRSLGRSGRMVSALGFGCWAIGGPWQPAGASYVAAQQQFNVSGGNQETLQLGERLGLAAIREVLTAGGRSLAQGALAWLWSRSAVTIPIPGFKTVAQAEENARAMAFGRSATSRCARSMRCSTGKREPGAPRQRPVLVRQPPSAPGVTPPGLVVGGAAGGRVGSGWTVLGGELAVPCTRNPL